MYFTRRTFIQSLAAACTASGSGLAHAQQPAHGNKLFSAVGIAAKLDKAARFPASTVMISGRFSGCCARPNTTGPSAWNGHGPMPNSPPHLRRSRNRPVNPEVGTAGSLITNTRTLECTVSSSPSLHHAPSCLTGIVRDLWRQKDIGPMGDTFSTMVSPHGVALVNIRS